MKRVRGTAAVIAAFLALVALPLPAALAGAASVAASAVDAAAAAKIISDYRAKHGLPAVKVEARLMKIAASHAQKMAAADALEHVLGGEGNFMKRITDGGYNPLMAAENIGAGYKTLADAIIGWETSPAHNANLLNRDISEIGIAVSSTPVGMYHAYWSLVMARPMPPPQASAQDEATPFTPRPFVPGPVVQGIFGILRRSD